ncbi:MAG: hypothetical protein ACLQIH_10265 [Myxococcaceae bacterium]
MRGLAAAVSVLAAACIHLTPFSPRALVGQTFPLSPGWSLPLALGGSVAGHAAVIRLAVEEPFSRVTEGCFASPPEVLAHLHTPALPTASLDGGPPSAKLEQQVLAPDVRLGQRVLGDVHALLDSAAGCELTLGSEVLVGFVLEVDPGARTVTFHSEMPPPPKFQAEQSVVLELTLDPRTDRPSLAVQLGTQGAPLTVPMVLATATERIQLSAAAGRALAGKDARPEGPAKGWVALRWLALAPSWELHHVVVSVQKEEAPADGVESGPAEAPSGLLGADAWGHYRSLIDLRGRQLVLYRRPPPVEEGDGPQSWTHLSSQSTQTGTLVRFISWQALDRGGQVPLEPVHGSLLSCRVGLTLGPEDPGYGLEVAIPWQGLQEALPECAKELAAVPAWTGELAAAAAQRPCSGSCLYAQALPSGRTVCACSSRPPAVLPSAGASVAPAVAPGPGPEAGEPEDPAAPRPPEVR